MTGIMSPALPHEYDNTIRISHPSRCRSDMSVSGTRLASQLLSHGIWFHADEISPLAAETRRDINNVFAASAAVLTIRCRRALLVGMNIGGDFAFQQVTIPAKSKMFWRYLKAITTASSVTVHELTRAAAPSRYLSTAEPLFDHVQNRDMPSAHSKMHGIRRAGTGNFKKSSMSTANGKAMPIDEVV